MLDQQYSLKWEVNESRAVITVLVSRISLSTKTCGHCEMASNKHEILTYAISKEFPTYIATRGGCPKFEGAHMEFLSWASRTLMGALTYTPSDFRDKAPFRLIDQAWSFDDEWTFSSSDSDVCFIALLSGIPGRCINTALAL